MARLTIPAKPFRPLTVMVDDAAMFWVAGTVDGLAAIVKSWTMNVTVAEWDREPLVPVTVT